MTIPSVAPPSGSYEVHNNQLVWTCSPILTDGSIYLVIIFTSHEPFTFLTPTLDSWTSLRFRESSGAYTDAGAPARIQNSVQTNPIPSQIYMGLAQFFAGDPVTFTFTGVGPTPPTDGAVLFLEVTGNLISEPYGFNYAANAGISTGALHTIVWPELVIAEEDSRVLRVIGVIRQTGAGDFTMDVTYGDPTFTGLLGADSDETSVPPWTAPERDDVTEFNYSGGGTGIWLTLTVELAGVFQLRNGWYVDQIGWGTR